MYSIRRYSTRMQCRITLYVGGEERSEGYYRFRFGEGAGARVERMQPALMEPEQWRVCPCTVEGAGALAEEAAPLAS